MTTPGMGLTLSTPNVTQGIGQAPPGQSWGEQQNSNFSIIDTHNHSPGSGVQIPTSGIAINADLAFAGFNATGLRSTRFSAIALGTIGPNDKSCLLASSGDLYFVDGAGNQVRITASGGVAGTPGAISGLVSPAAVTYTPASKLFTFTSSTPRVAGISLGPLTIGDASVDNGFGVTISAPAGLVASYALTLPGALPGSDGLLRLATTGALSAFGTIAGSNLTLAGSLTLAANLSLGTSANPIIQATAANAAISILGNRNAADANPDLALGATNVRSAGILAYFQNGGTNKLGVDFQGLLALVSQAGPIQPTSYVTTITPNANWGANNGLAYWKDAAGKVHLKGMVTFATGGTQPAFTFPVGFRPTAIRRFVVYENIGGAAAELVVDSATGNVSILQISGGGPVNGSQFFLDSVSFLAEQ